MSVKPEAEKDPNHTGKPIEHAVIVFSKTTEIPSSLEYTKLLTGLVRLSMAKAWANTMATNWMSMALTAHPTCMGLTRMPFFEVVKPILFEVDWLQDSKIKLRYGPPGDGVKERYIKLQ
ncbi:MAG: hypothetical protein AAGC44_02910 [Planctomycetota bacterium]